MPPELSGHAGRYRAPREQCLLDNRQRLCGNRSLAKPLACCRRRSALTRKEAKRLLLWAVLEKAKPLSSLNVEDAAAFMAFLEAPPDAWCGPRRPRAGGR